MLNPAMENPDGDRGGAKGNTPANQDPSFRVVVVGNGMVAQRFLEDLAATEAHASGTLRASVLGEETHPAYDRVALSSLFNGATEDDLHLPSPNFHSEHGIECIRGDQVTAIEPAAKLVRTSAGTVVEYDHLVLATGSKPFVPPIASAESEGCFVYRTIDDLAAISEWADRPEVRSGAVIGGGLLGLEAANALRLLGVETHVVEFADRLMPAQLDERGAAVLRGHVEKLGLTVHTSMRTSGVRTDAAGRATALEFDNAEPLVVDMVVYSAGIRPRDELAEAACLDRGERGGFAVDSRMRTTDPHISAIGECASVQDRCYGLVAPGYQMASVAAAHIAAEAGAAPEPDDGFTGADMSTKLKLLGVDVATVGTLAADDSVHRIVLEDPTTGVYKRLDTCVETGRVLGAAMVGDAAPYSTILGLYRQGEPLDIEAAALIAPAGEAPVTGDPLICSCENVCSSNIAAAISEGADTVGCIKERTRAGTGCGGCVPDLENALLTALGATAVICDHLPVSRPELYELVKISSLQRFEDIHRSVNPDAPVIEGCEICKPAVASVLASINNDYILDEHQASLQDTNDHFLANMQRDGTYSVVPRIPGGEITPEKLIVIGEVARDFDLYTKITGGQRIDLFGATVDQLPRIWQRLVDAGMESGHAYGKALRTVKSCVGETWCRYGVQDSTSMAILLEERYRGLRAPHKIKLAVSGCARECAEAQSKDVGVIATERGWNLYVGGNGGKTPRHAKLLAEDLDDEELVRYIDRFLMYYVRSADRLERTAPWVERLEGGMEQLRRVVVDDVLGLAAEFEADMERHVSTYACEWTETLNDPERMKRFVTFVNAPDEPDPTVVFVRERDQIRPALPEERLEMSTPPMIGA